ncbi:MAG: SRPBCC domain-containing protein [Ktedonobacteraceae bacterium]
MSRARFINYRAVAEMIMVVTFEAEDGGTTVSIFFKDIPSGIRPEDNEAGTRSTLEKLARYVE